MKTNLLGYPRIGKKRGLKFALEKYWKKELSIVELEKVAGQIRRENWQTQRDMGIDLIPSNDFSLYDQMLDASLSFGCIPERFSTLRDSLAPIDLYFAMARGFQEGGEDITALEMTKWFDTNYHFLVPEFTKDQEFQQCSSKAVDEFKEALALGIKTKPVLISPVTYLYLGKEMEAGFHRIELLPKLRPIFFTLLEQLSEAGAEYVQIDEPCLALDLSDMERRAIVELYNEIAAGFPDLKIVLANYFDCYGNNLNAVLQLPVHAIHLDLVRCPLQLDDVLTSPFYTGKQLLSLGVVDGRNIWKNKYGESLSLLQKAGRLLSNDRIWIASSCSLLHCPLDLDLEGQDDGLPGDIVRWMAFSKQKLQELVDLKQLQKGELSPMLSQRMEDNEQVHKNRENSLLVHHEETKKRVGLLTAKDSERKSEFPFRRTLQQQELGLPLYPTTTIGSFPQTKTVRGWRAKYKKGAISREEYERLIKEEIIQTIRFQEKLDLDVLVHGESERNDMVEYFGEQLQGFAFTAQGWVQSYGSRCVKPPIIYGDVRRPMPMTVDWTAFAQSLTPKPVKGMLTGPVTILQWSFVRNDQPRSQTCRQIALAIRDEVLDLERAGLKVIQIDEPAIREGLPLRREYWANYLDWAVECFRIAASGVKDTTQIHTHMCYSEFNDIIESISHMDADVITIETSRSQMDLLDAFVNFKYPNGIGPGVYDIHSPRVPNTEEMESLLIKAGKLLPTENIWVNPDCGLKTRDWPETESALRHMVRAAQNMRAALEA
ncbi:MAG: 5-methyltetrahydropteroyltriglutamate--homocysteine S-methyltransferase [Sediminicola sp.]